MYVCTSSETQQLLPEFEARASKWSQGNVEAVYTHQGHQLTSVEYYKRLNLNILSLRLHELAYTLCTENHVHVHVYWMGLMRVELEWNVDVKLVHNNSDSGGDW
jgi:transposase InsO family protein